MCNSTTDEFELDIEGSCFTSSVLYHAIKSGQATQVVAALNNGEDPCLCDSQFGTTFLHLVALTCDAKHEDRYETMIYQLCNGGADPNTRDYRGCTALAVAMKRERLNIMAALLRCGTDPNAQDYQGVIRSLKSPCEKEIAHVLDKYEPGLWAAVESDNIGMVHMLLNCWCRVNITKHNQTLLQYAIDTRCSRDLITLLDDFEVTLEFVHATLAGDEKRMLEFLMDAKPCDPNIMDISYQANWSAPLTPRSLRDTALAMGHQNVLHLLPEPESAASGNVPQIVSNSSIVMPPSALNCPPSPTKHSMGSADEYVYQFFHPAKFRPSNEKRVSLTDGSDTLIEEPLRVERKCYYFQELDNLVESVPISSKRKSSLRKNLTYKNNWKQLEVSKSGKSKETKSKLCVIS